jgi:putative membrane protein
VTARWLAASLHLLALGIGLGAVWARGRSLRLPLKLATLRQVFLADSLWGLAAVLWISTGLWRMLAGLEKGTGYYLQNHVFLAKMALLIFVLLLELRPMVTLIRWRTAVSRGQTPDTSRAQSLARISFIQAGLIVLMVFAATAMARGVGM